MEARRFLLQDQVLHLRSNRAIAARFIPDNPWQQSNAEILQNLPGVQLLLYGGIAHDLSKFLACAESYSYTAPTGIIVRLFLLSSERG